ncbi:hypothetical protein SERLA73DRAFT_187995 [Serpula lacrymans var. lacrymans S7.3]|uniref:Uncharacterized protein n=2 Tax=Serpula lacrymans var. lacrymans TaxID=341189 RepID=F8Q9Z2_SERL3|nr:uncharacterized protein SERLADRAFT_477933 [Serpula lacrymans var. lacrymans S7.9]EGN94897.1 hypothetical protein SERLA73DRAFT_187995 [Serpula lacrymans var. lacrymans S7.3]EGO20397.1 hypothetical protein SERLADRAFT_477933 [Serpula lacrymans var. lacrymans S7.9]
MVPSARSPLLDILWQDGIMYFIVLLATSLINIFLILEQPTPQIGIASMDLQTCLHSMLSTRSVLHLASLNPNVEDISSIHTCATTANFTTNIDFVEVGAQGQSESDMSNHVEMLPQC